MRSINIILANLDEAGATGLDMSPGDPLCAEAAERIRYLSQELYSVDCAVERLQRDKIILREALVRLVGESNLDELRKMLHAFQAIAGSRSDDAQAAAQAIQALLDTV